MFHKIISLMVGKREKRGGRSAWTLCSGLPLWIARRVPRSRGQSRIHTQGSHGASAVRGAPTRASHALPSPPFSLPSTQRKHTAFSREEGKEGRERCVDTLQWASVMDRTAPAARGAPKRASHALPSSPISLLSTSYFHHSQFPRMTIQYTLCRASPVACSASSARKQIITILFATSYNF